MISLANVLRDSALAVKSGRIGTCWTSARPILLTLSRHSCGVPVSVVALIACSVARGACSGRNEATYSRYGFRWRVSTEAPGARKASLQAMIAERKEAGRTSGSPRHARARRLNEDTAMDPTSRWG